MSSGPICAMVWEGRDAVKTGRGTYLVPHRHLILTPPQPSLAPLTHWHQPLAQFEATTLLTLAGMSATALIVSRMPKRRLLSGSRKARFSRGRVPSMTGSMRNRFSRELSSQMKRFIVSCWGISGARSGYRGSDEVML
jgi:hypothetical protein